MSFDTHSTAILPLLQIFEKLFFFQKKTHFRTYLINLTISVAFYGKFAINW